jgi:hypothetical protein
MINFDILDTNELICRVIITDTLLCPTLQFNKKVDLSKINESLLETLLNNKNELLMFTYKCYGKYLECNNDIIYNPVHYQCNFWIKFIILSIHKNIKKKSLNKLIIRHGCCTDQCNMIDDLCNIILSEL